jgi:homoserine O-acetyltransferase/O-succinyltransferase
MREASGQDTGRPASFVAAAAGSLVVALLPVAFLLVAVLLVMPAGVRAQDTTDHAAHVYDLGAFTVESGATIPQATLVYGTYGHLNARHDNAILLPSHYMADHHGYGWLIGPALALDTTKYFLIATEMFGNGHSSSPSNTPEPFHGPRFPVTTIRDNVEAVHRLLTQELGITHLRAVIGFSMGAQQAFQWAVSYPTFMDRIVATSGTAKCYGHGFVRLEGQIAAIEADGNFKGGDYTEEPARGIDAFGAVWAGWLYSQEWWRREMWRSIMPKATSAADAMAAIVKGFEGADANNYILQARTWERHDVGTTKGFDGNVERALRSITVPVLYMPSATDLYFPLGDAEYEKQFIAHVQFVPIPSLWGHPAGAGQAPEDRAFLNTHIRDFLGQH